MIDFDVLWQIVSTDLQPLTDALAKFVRPAD
jgi:hypothetical protein